MNSSTLNAIPLLGTIAFFVLGMAQVQAQISGCTDPLANNHNPDATENDGSCTYNPTTVTPENSYALDAAISESSGLVYWDDKIWTHVDDTDVNLYALEPSNGSIVQKVSLAPATNTDWEEVSQDETYIYVADFGNNAAGNRTDLNILRIAKASILAEKAEIENINFTYADQTDFGSQGANNTDYDCEAFIVTEDAIFLFTKEWNSLSTRIYKLPKKPGSHQAEVQDGLDVNGLITGADYNPAGEVIALSGYSISLQPFVYLLYDYEDEDFFGGNKRKIMVNLSLHQVEGITTLDGLNYFISNENFPQAGTTQKLHTLDFTDFLEQTLSIIPIGANAKFKVFPNPTTSILEVRNAGNPATLAYTIFDTTGKTVQKGLWTITRKSIDITNLSTGTYILKMGEEKSNSFRIIKR